MSRSRATCLSVLKHSIRSVGLVRNSTRRSVCSVQLLGAVLAAASGLGAQTATPVEPPRSLHVDAAALRPVQLTYQQTVERDSVIGDDNIRVPAGQFDCWVVSVRGGEGARGLYWVTKRDPVVVRSTLDVPALGGAQLVSVLTRVTR